MLASARHIRQVLIVCACVLMQQECICKPYSYLCSLFQTSFEAKWRVKMTWYRSNATLTHASQCTPPVTDGQNTRASSVRKPMEYLKKVSTLSRIENVSATSVTRSHSPLLLYPLFTHLMDIRNRVCHCVSCEEGN